MNNDWREYYDPQYVLMHHGIKGQKWGVRQYQNPDGTLTAAGKARYGAKADQVEKYARKAASWEGRYATSLNVIGRGVSSTMASFRRRKADKLAEKATGDYKLLALNKNAARAARSDAETRANIAQNLKNKADNSSGSKQKVIMERAIRNLALAENNEGMGAKMSAVSKAPIGTKTATFISKTLKESVRSNAGRERKALDRIAEHIGDQVINSAVQTKAKQLTDKIDERAMYNGGYKKSDKAAKVGIKVAANVAGRGVVSGGRDVVYRAKNSQKKRWDSMARG